MSEVLDVTKEKPKKHFDPTPRDRAIATAVLRSREAKNWTQTELAKKVGISLRSLQRYEQTQRAFPEGVLNLIEGQVGPCRPSIEVKSLTSEVVSDPDRKVSNHEISDGGYTVKYTESEYVARKLDAIEDEATRMRAMTGCAAAISEALHPQTPGADNSGTASRHNL